KPPVSQMLNTLTAIPRVRCSIARSATTRSRPPKSSELTTCTMPWSRGRSMRTGLPGMEGVGRARVVASPCYAGRAADRPRGPPGWPKARVDLVVVIRPRSRALGANGGRSHPNRALHESAVQRCRGDPRGGDDHGIDL